MKDAEPYDLAIRLDNIENIFDDRVAASGEFRYNGVDCGDKWRTKVRGCWISKCLLLLHMFHSAEKHGVRKVVRGSWRGNTVSGRRVPDEQMDRLSQLICGFLNISLTDGACIVFESADTLNGFDAWRALV